jgi:5'-methylthioadenosine phosphorylase
MKPLDFVIPDQFVDRTNQGRESTFFTGGIVAHISFAHPVSKELTDILTQAAKTVGVRVHAKATYINMEGPQFSTKAESNLYRQWGMDIIGMTNMAEAKLAREAEIAYATLASVTDYDCWHDGHEEVTLEMILANLSKNVENSKEILKIAIPEIGKLTKFEAHDALKNAIVTQKERIPEDTRRKLVLLIGKYIQ